MGGRAAATDVSVAEQRERFRAWLRRRTGNAPIRVIETHVSIVGMSTDRVWKLKKAVRLPFIDLSTVTLRARNAEREVALNRRFAPDVYLGVVPLDDAGGVTTDAVVEMRRMPDERRLAVVAKSATAGDCVDRIAAELARIHRDSPASAEIDRAGSRDAVAELWARNLEELRPFAGSVLDAAELDRVAAGARRYLAGRAALFEQRIAAGRIRDGHGDLLADDVFCLDDGPRLLDCLEFDDELRYGDVLADVGFLAMDLERLGHRDLADRLLDRYREISGDSWPASLADLYIAYRAVVRSKIACLPGASGSRAASRATARGLLALAARHIAHGRVRLVIVGGPPGTGKTTLAGALERRTGWTAVHSDEVRKRLAGLEPTTTAADALDAGLYTPEWTARTYDALFATATQLLERGENVILDASWSDRGRRDAAARLAASTSSVMSNFVLTAPPELAAVRARARASAHVDASDASGAVADALRERFAPWPGAIELDAADPVEVIAERVLADHDLAV